MGLISTTEILLVAEIGNPLRQPQQLTQGLFTSLDAGPAAGIAAERRHSCLPLLYGHQGGAGSGARAAGPACRSHAAAAAAAYPGDGRSHYRSPS